MNTNKILILRLSSIGDIILSTFFIRQVANAFPEYQIDFVIKKQFENLLLDNPYLKKILCLYPEKGITQLIKLKKEIKNSNYKYIFDLHNNIRTRILLLGLIKSRIWRIKKEKFKRVLLVYLKWNRYKKIKPIPIRYLDVGREAGVIDDEKGLELFWENNAEENLKKKYPVLLDDPYFVLAPGAGFYSKKWPIEYFMELVEMLTQNRKEKIIILGGYSDMDDGNELNLNNSVINLTGKLELIESAIVLKNAKVLVSNDSGLMHMATAVNTPVLAIFGSTVEELGFFPFRNKHCIIQNTKLNCRPCSHIGKDYCPKGHFRCMVEIEPVMVYDELFKLIDT